MWTFRIPRSLVSAVIFKISMRQVQSVNLWIFTFSSKITDGFDVAATAAKRGHSGASDQDWGSNPSIYRTTVCAVGAIQRACRGRSPSPSVVSVPDRTNNCMEIQDIWQVFNLFHRRVYEAQPRLENDVVPAVDAPVELIGASAPKKVLCRKKQDGFLQDSTQVCH